MYSDVFCKVYNEFGWNYYPEAFGEQLLVWLQERGLQVSTALDLGCGTGILCRILDQAGIAVFFHYASDLCLSGKFIAV